MPYDWLKSADRMIKTLAGRTKRIDKVGYWAIIDEQIMSRVMGLTTREILSSPQTYANCLIKTAEFLQVDVVFPPSAYAGPSEAYAFAQANDKMETIKWYDYKPLAITQGAVCKTEEDIDNLEIPDHNKVDIWKLTHKTSKLMQEKTKIPQWWGTGIWSVVQELRGIEAYKDIRRNPDLLMKLCEKIYQSQLDSYKAWIENVGPSPYIFFAGYSFNKHMMSFKDSMKYEGQFIQRLQKETNSLILLHNCGTKPYFEEVCSEIDIAAVQGSHPLDIKYWINFQKKFPQITIMGANIDVSRELLTGNPQDVEDKVRENIINLAATGKYIVSPICCLPWGVPLPNLMAIPKAIETYGKYPINTD